MKISLFTRDAFKGRDSKGRARLAFNPYLQIGAFEVCIDANGIAIHTVRRSMGFIRGSGFWHRRAA